MKSLISLFFVNWCFILFAFAQQTIPTKWENIAIDSIPNPALHNQQGDILIKESFAVSGSNTYRLRTYQLIDDYTSNWEGVKYVLDKYSNFKTGFVYSLQGNNRLIPESNGTIFYPDMTTIQIYESLYQYYSNKYQYYLIVGVGTMVIFIGLYYLYRRKKQSIA